MNAGTRHFLLMGHALRQAAEQQEFILHYQPQYALESRALIGFEALVRWRHPDLGLIPPAEFLPLAEDSGFISQLGEWIFRQACHQGRLWLDQNQGPLRMAVKLTGRQFWQENLVDRLRQALVDSGLPPSCLELEIAESHLTAQPDLASTRLRELAALGARLAIDHFGAGATSLSALRHYPVHSLKLDRSLVHGIGAGGDGLVRAVIDLAHSLGLAATAEAIETREQLDFLVRQGCDSGQGFLFSPAVAEQTLACLLNGKPEMA